MQKEVVVNEGQERPSWSQCAEINPTDRQVFLAQKSASEMPAPHYLIFCTTTLFLLWIPLRPRLHSAGRFRLLPLPSWSLPLSWPGLRRVFGASHPGLARCRAAL